MKNVAQKRKTARKDVYKASLVKRKNPKRRKRRTRAEVEELLDATRNILNSERHQITIRHLFYRLTGVHVVEKTENEYGNVDRFVAQWRRAKEIPYSCFADSTRWYIRKETFDSVEDALQRCRETYRRDMWANQPYYAEVWVEKDAIAAIVANVANEWGVPVFVCRGFASLTGLYSASQTFKQAIAAGKKVIILHIGDYDPSGHLAGSVIERSFQKDFDCKIQFKRIAVLPEQIRRLNLPTRPTKESTHSKNWKGDDSVEVDTIPTEEMRSIVEDAITALIDDFEWKQLKKIEAAERDSMERLQIVK